MSRKQRRPQQLATAAPTIAELQHRAMDSARAGKPAEALEACRAILAQDPARPDVLAFAASLASGLGDLAAAEGFFRQALTFKPDFIEAHYNLAGTLKQLGRLEEAAESYRSALALRPDLMPAHHNLGNVLYAQGRYEDAVAAYRRALASEETAEGARDLGIALHKLGRLDEAIAAYRRALALPRHRIDLYSNLANALMEQGDMGGALAACESWLSLRPGEIEATALMAHALRDLGRETEARFILDFDRFVQVVDLDPPPGYGNMAEFNAALVRHVEAHPTLHVPSKDHPTYHNDALEKTNELLAEPKGPMAALEAMVDARVAHYLRTVTREPRHPFLDHFPKAWRYTAWATRLQGQGNLAAHIHFDGYMGAVYYPLLPDIVTAPDGVEAGWFELGRPPERLNCKAAPKIRRIQPKEGRLLLFPGYFFHSTVPFASSQRRISIAFDLMRRT